MVPRAQFVKETYEIDDFTTPSSSTLLTHDISNHSNNSLYCSTKNSDLDVQSVALTTSDSKQGNSLILESLEDSSSNCEGDDIEMTLLPKRKKHSKIKDNSTSLYESDTSSKIKKYESASTIALQITFPFLMAGMGMVAAGLVLDKVQHWDVFQKVPEVFILVPALLGLKGNLEMTLASRLSTAANIGLLDDRKTMFKIVWGNMVLVETQAMVVAFLASLVAMIFGWIPDGTWETNHAIILCVGSLLTGAIASGVLGAIMMLVILLSRKCGLNPDNIATPIAAALGDLTTLTLLAYIVEMIYGVLYSDSTSWLGWFIICIFIFSTPFFLYISYRNPFTKDVIKNGWEPIIVAMAISSIGGLILDLAVSLNAGVAVFAPVINGVGGNFVAVQASRISTYLHSSKYKLGELPPSKSWDCATPYRLFCESDSPHARGARVMLFMVIPGQLIFLLTIGYLKAGHTTLSIQFVAVYLLLSLIQVMLLLFICHWLVHRLWRNKHDPDNCAIPYLTAFGDLLGTGLLALGFAFLWLVGDRDDDVGD